jgi:hypothetical protein
MAASFYLVVFDRDRDQCSVEGPMSDDKQWIEAIARAAESGRNVRCWQAADEGDRAKVEDGLKRLFSYEVLPPGSIVALNVQ